MRGGGPDLTVRVGQGQGMETPSGVFSLFSEMRTKAKGRERGGGGKVEV